MKVLLYGSKGWIGNIFLEIIQKDNIQFIEGKARCDNEKELKEEIENINPTHIFFSCGRTRGTLEDGTKINTIDYLEKGKLYENIRDNLFSHILLAHICNEKNIHLTAIETGCIFNFSNKNILHEDGTVENGYTEEDNGNYWGSSYSCVKLFCDRLLKLYNNNTLVLRIRMPITETVNPRNFITKITTYEKICSVPNSITILPELLPIALDMMKTKSVGTYNFTNPGVISHNEILEMYRTIVNPDFTWKNFSIEEQDKILASKRSNNYLDTTKLENYVKSRNLELSHIKEGVCKVLHDYKEDLEKEEALEG